MSGSGAALFARYAYPPNELGYCGPSDASVLLVGRTPDTADAEMQITAHARQFEGAWAYLQLIAGAAGIEDPLDTRVVEAYWIGNSLLDDIDPEHAARWLQERFPVQPLATWAPGLPHHCFQVFAVYPWSALLHRDPRNAMALRVLDQCRIRWGEVIAVEGSRVRARTRPLVLRKGALELAAAGESSAAWAVGGSSLLSSPVASDGAVPPVAVGDQVAMHWDWVCDVLTPTQVTQMESRSTDQLA
ncbi:MAG: DUF6390 family protein, partial [Mycobacteriales bacterium]